MEEFDLEPETGEEERGTTEEGTISSEEEAFMKGYSEEDEIKTCDECGSALHGKNLTKTIDGEEHHFCSPDCAKEFEESLGSN